MAVETAKDRVELARDAGLGRFSLFAVLAGTLAAYGAFALFAAIASGVASALDLDVTGLSDNDWRTAGTAAAITIGVLLFLSYLFGGYVAGRMARRAGLLHGFGVFVLGVLLAGGLVALVAASGETGDATGNLRTLGVPTTWEEWKEIGTIAGIASLVAMLLGSLLGGKLGDRWHTKLLNRALDPRIGPAAQARGWAEDRESASRERVERATVIHGQGQEVRHDELAREPERVDVVEQRRPVRREVSEVTSVEPADVGDRREVTRRPGSIQGGETVVARPGDVPADSGWRPLEDPEDGGPRR